MSGRVFEVMPLPWHSLGHPHKRSIPIRSIDTSDGSVMVDGMDTRLLRTFTTVARTENLTAAAEDLHLVQSTVTAQVQALEKELDVRLFDRLPRGVVLTGAGREVLAQAEAVLEAEAQ